MVHHHTSIDTTVQISLQNKLHKVNLLTVNMRNISLNFFFALISLALTQGPHPVPVPVNISSLTGTWNVVMNFDAGFNNSIPRGLTCWQWDISSSGNQISVNENLLIEDVQLEQSFGFTPQCVHFRKPSPITTSGIQVVGESVCGSVTCDIFCSQGIP